MKNLFSNTAVFETTSNMDANFLNLHIDKARKTSDDKQLYWQQMIITDDKLRQSIINAYSIHLE